MMYEQLQTEGQAKKKACHQSMNKTPYAEKCRGCECMAWRWGSDGWQYADGRVISTNKEPHGRGQWVARGYCGLAGGISE